MSRLARFVFGALLCAFVSYGTAAMAATLVYPTGTKVTIEDIDPADGFFALKADFVGRTGITTSTLSSTDGGTWWSGSILMDGDANPVTFFKVKVSSTSTPTTQINDKPSFDAFGSASYPAVTGAIPGASVTSNTFTITGIDVAIPISIIGGEYSIDGGAFTSAAGTVTLNQTVTLRVVAASTLGGIQTAILTAGSGSTTFKVTTTTTPGDYTPDAFSFAPITNAAPGAASSSAAITVSGIDATTSIAISGGEYAIDGGTFTTASGTIGLGSKVVVRVTAASVNAQTVTATLTIGGVSGSFSVTTSFVPVTSASEIFSNPQTTTVSNNIVTITSAPAEPLQLKPDAVLNAVIRIDSGVKVPVVATGGTLQYEPQTTNTSLVIKDVGGSKSLQIETGTVNITAPTLNSTIPVAGDNSGNSSSLNTSAADTKVIASRDENRNVVVAIDQGKVRFTGTASGRALPSAFDIYSGEAVLTDTSGAAGQLRFGSVGQNQGKAGDFIAAIPKANTTLKVPLVSGSPARFGEALSNVVARALATKLGLASSGATLTQSSQTGVMTLTTGGVSYRFLPIGTLAIDLSSTTATKATQATRAISVGAIANNLLAIVGESLEFAVAPAASYADLETALKQISATASVEILGDGAIRAVLGSNQYIGQPAAQLIPGGSGCPKLDESLPEGLAVCDASGNRQVLYPAFRDTDFLVSTFATALAPTSVTASNSGLGRYTATLAGAPYTLTPDLLLSVPPASQAGKLWWQEGVSRFVIRYPNGTAQGFSVQ